jgi:hypothetical protein
MVQHGIRLLDSIRKITVGRPMHASTNCACLQELVAASAAFPLAFNAVRFSGWKRSFSAGRWGRGR